MGSGIFEYLYDRSASGYDHQDVTAIDIQIRILAGMWIACGLYLFIILNTFKQHGGVLRIVFLAMAISAAGEFTATILHRDEFWSSLIKVVIQIGFCIAMDIWRAYLVDKAPEKMIQQDIA